MKIVFTPDWFLGSDVLIEIFSFIILFLFFYFSIRNYKLSKNKNFLYLGLGFLLIAIAELATTLTKVVLYYDTTLTQQVGQMIVTYKVVKSVDIFYYIGFFFHKLFTLLGFYVIYRLPLKKKTSGDLLIALCFIFISALFSQAFYYLFHLTALILLILITNNYYEIYKKNKANNTKILIMTFSILALSQIIFILSKLSMLYVMAQIIQLVSYIMLLILIIKIFKLQNYKTMTVVKNQRFLKYGKKKKSN